MRIYRITETDDYELVITENGTICELFPCGKLFTTGEAVHPDELPVDGWEDISCNHIRVRP